MPPGTIQQWNTNFKLYQNFVYKYCLKQSAVVVSEQPTPLLSAELELRALSPDPHSEVYSTIALAFFIHCSVLEFSWMSRAWILGSAWVKVPKTLGALLRLPGTGAWRWGTISPLLSSPNADSTVLTTQGTIRLAEKMHHSRTWLSEVYRISLP